MCFCLKILWQGINSAISLVLIINNINIVLKNLGDFVNLIKMFLYTNLGN